MKKQKLIVLNRIYQTCSRTRKRERSCSSTISSEGSSASLANSSFSVTLSSSNNFREFNIYQVLSIEELTRRTTT